MRITHCNWIWFAISLCVALTLGVSPDTETDDNDHDQTEEIEEVIVRAHPLSSKSMVGDVLVVSDAHGESRGLPPGNLGQTVENIPGIRNAPFGQGVGQVMIQGLDGPRVMYLYDRLQTMDAALSSRDHPPMMEPIIADQIEVLKGPSTLLYGSGSSGGVINTESGRIPRDLSIKRRKSNEHNQEWNILAGQSRSWSYQLSAWSSLGCKLPR